MNLPAALLFDFDGLILDTETCTYETVAAIFAEHGAELDVAWWHSILGTADRPHWVGVLAAQVGRPLDHEALVAQREERRLAILQELPVCAGVADLLDAADASGVPAAVVSSSASDWVDGHLTRLGLRPRFAEVVTKNHVGGDPRRTKPAPDLYLIAAAALAVDPSRCVVLEDSPNGVAAGRAAGMAVVAVPGPMTAELDFAAADLVVTSLGELSIGRLAALLTPS